MLKALIVISFIISGCTMIQKQSKKQDYSFFKKLSLKNKNHQKKTIKRSIASFEDKVANLDPNKKTVCTITINSKDEREVFKQALPNFNFIELTDHEEEGDPESWMDQSCESGLKCDVLVVSGHFGGSFFGDSGKELSMEKLEALSCTNSCEGILNNPKEVFLFGCNTLAGKAQDHRSPEEYIRVLVEDDFSVLEAQQIAAFRYSPVGPSFHDRMSRAFSSVEKLYGFDSVGPAGQNVRHMLVDYFKRIPSYDKHLSEVTAEKSNANWTKALAVTSQAQSAGSKNKMSSSSCKLMSNDSDNSKLSYIKEVFNDEMKLLETLPFIAYYLEQIEEDVDYNGKERSKRLSIEDIEKHKKHKRLKAKHPDTCPVDFDIDFKKFQESTTDLEKIFAGVSESFKKQLRLEIATNENAKKVFDKYLKKDVPGMMQIRAMMLKISKELQIFSDKQIASYEKKLIGNLKTGNVPRERAELICSYDIKLPDLTVDSFYSGEWDAMTMYTILCLGVEDVKVADKAFKHISSKNDMLRESSRYLIQTSGYNSQKILKYFKDEYLAVKQKMKSKKTEDLSEDMFFEAEELLTSIGSYQATSQSDLAEHVKYLMYEAKALNDFANLVTSTDIHNFYISILSDIVQNFYFDSKNTFDISVLNIFTELRSVEPDEYEEMGMLMEFTKKIIVENIDCKDKNQFVAFEKESMKWIDQYLPGKSSNLYIEQLSLLEINEEEGYVESSSSSSKRVSEKEFRDYYYLSDDIEKKCGNSETAPKPN